MKKGLVSAILMSIVLIFGISEAVETKLVIRARSKDAKFIGTKMGGALVVIRDSKTGKVLVEGMTAGSTGDTQKIMIEPKARFGRITDGSAQFETSLDIDEPTLITITVAAPYMYKENMIESSTQMWLIPGKDIAGEGVVIEVPGFSIDARTPEKAQLVNNRATIPIEASIVMI
jgi:hypothetical protein